MADMKRDVTVTTNLGPDVLLCAGMTATEEMSRPFEYVVDLLTQEEDIELHKLIGQPMTVHLKIAEGKTRHFNGLVSKVAFTGSAGDYHTYRATVRPWLWTLTRRTDCRVFQDMTVTDIVKEVFRDAGFSDFEEKLSGSYVERGYCVQYRETDLDFVSRLLEEEGIYYYFLHEDGKHTMVLADSINAHAPFDGHADMKFFPPGRTETLEEPHIFDWSVSHEYRTNIFAQTDYDFTEPTKDLATNASIPRDHTRAEYEVYDYPGGYTDAGDGDTLAKIRIEELQAGYERCEGTGNVPGVAVGHLFTLGNHPRGDQNQEYLVLSCRHRLTVGSYESKSAGGGDASYEVDFTVQPSAQAYRPPRITPKPGVRGPQSATVVGPDGETVWCDEYGRIKIQFHWDRVGEVDENSSCWVRVSQPSAGSNWGSMFLPHIGQEVIVDFLEGDPDKPIITGRVYNADNMPPLTLPDNKHKSIIRDHYGNEVIFDGTPGEEHLSLYSPSHHSVMKLGKSVQTFSKSDDISYTYDTKISYHYGDSFGFTRGFTFGMHKGGYTNVKLGFSGSATVGTSVSVFGGLKLNATAGASYDITYGHEFKYGHMRSFNRTKGSYTRSSADDYIVDSEKTVFVTGGKNDNTLISANDSKMILSFDKTKTKRDIGKLDMLPKGLFMGTAVLIAAGSTAATLMYQSGPDGVEQLDANGKHTMDIETDQLVSVTKGDITMMGTAAIGVIGSVVATKMVKKQPPPSHPNPSAKIELRDNIVEITAGKSDETKASFHPDTGFIVETKASMRLESKDGIFIEAPKRAEIKSKSLYVKAMIDQKNLKVLG